MTYLRSLNCTVVTVMYVCILCTYVTSAVAHIVVFKMYYNAGARESHVEASPEIRPEIEECFGKVWGQSHHRIGRERDVELEDGTWTHIDCNLADDVAVLTYTRSLPYVYTYFVLPTPKANSESLTKSTYTANMHA